MVHASLISMVWSEGISEREAGLFKATVQQMLTWLFLRHPDALTERPIHAHALGEWAAAALGADRVYARAQSYADSSFDAQLQRVIAPVYLELVRRRPSADRLRHLELALLHFDLTDFPAPLARLRPDHHSLGSSFPGESAVMSTSQLDGIEDVASHDLALRRLVRHHLGHLLGAPHLGRKHHVERMGLELHCTNRCAMRHAPDVDSLVAMAKEERAMGWPFCEDCTRDLHSAVARHMCSDN